MEFFPWSRKFLDAKNTVRRILHERILKTIHFILSPRKILLLKAWRKMNVRLNGCVCWFFPCGTTTKKWNGDRNQLMKTVLKLRAFYHENPILHIKIYVTYSAAPSPKDIINADFLV